MFDFKMWICYKAKEIGTNILLIYVIVLFPDWGPEEEDAEDINVWEDNWDDDNIEDDFSQQLKWECEDRLVVKLGMHFFFKWMNCHYAPIPLGNQAVEIFIVGGLQAPTMPSKIYITALLIHQCSL